MGGIIEVKNLSKVYNGLRAVDEVSFSVGEGEIFGLLGPNGAGKTTLIKMLTTLLRPSGGEAYVAGHNILTESEAIKDKIGVVFEFQNFYERLSARANLLFFAELYGVNRNRVNELLSLVGLLDRAKEPIYKYSKGMGQRLMIARSLLNEPQILFLDEPTTGLDPHSTYQLYEIISGLNKKGTTIFLSTHRMEVADRLCQRIAIMNKGEIVALDYPTNLKLKYGKDYFKFHSQETSLEEIFLKLTEGGLE